MSLASAEHPLLTPVFTSQLVWGALLPIQAKITSLFLSLLSNMTAIIILSQEAHINSAIHTLLSLLKSIGLERYNSSQDCTVSKPKQAGFGCFGECQ